MELVEESDRAEWERLRGAGLPRKNGSDARLLGVHRDKKGRRSLTMVKALESIEEVPLEDWPFRGPRASMEFLSRVGETYGDLTLCFNTFVRKSGLSEASHEAKNLVEMLRMSIVSVLHRPPCRSSFVARPREPR